ncbi:hypothetical protein K0M31_010335 [Melipona bicolor]|uniref:Uncharacterized protein n=1 Tax=Melipona bicolor TaxID=60889 RepID=A0AA40KID5_9HYME|nr:hypothetical protein K0M31_010335 [Melipona bicolor]
MRGNPGASSGPCDIVVRPNQGERDLQGAYTWTDQTAGPWLVTGETRPLSKAPSSIQDDAGAVYTLLAHRFRSKTSP